MYNMYITENRYYLEGVVGGDLTNDECYENGQMVLSIGPLFWFRQPKMS